MPRPCGVSASVEPIPVGGRDEAAFRAALANPGIRAVHICTPNAAHFPMAKAALEAGKARAVREAAGDVVRRCSGRWSDLAQGTKSLRNCTCHNLRYYPMVQHMRRMREDGDLGEILVVQGTYSQDWLLYDTDWNWRIDSKEGGPSRALADIGSHWCDMAEHVTGQRITRCARICRRFTRLARNRKARSKRFHGQRRVRNRPGRSEDFGAVIFRMGDRARGDIHGQPGFGGPQEPAQHRDLRKQVRRRMGPGAARRAVDRQSQHEQPDHHQRSLAVKGRRAFLRRSARRPQRRLRRHVQAGLSPLLRVDRKPGRGAGVSAVCRRAAAVDHLGSRTGESSSPCLGQCTIKPLR